jgi:toxin ParE1/3/4
MPKLRDVVVSENALRDMEEIYLYIAQESGAVVALQILNALEERCDSLSELPERGNRPKELLAAGVMKYRELHYKPYRLIYEVGDKTVIVHAVLDGRRDMSVLLQQRLPKASRD